MTPRQVDPVVDVLAALGDAVLRYDPDGTVVWASPSLSALLGYDPVEVVGSRLEVNDPEDLPEARRVMREAEQDRLPQVRVRSRMVRADGARIWVDTVTRLLWSDGGVLEGYVAALRDVTEQAEAERRLAESEARYRMLLDNAADVVFHTEGGLVTWVSPAVERLLGWAAGDLVGRPTVGFWHPDDRAVAVSLRDAAYGGRSGQGVFRFRTPDGAYRWVDVAVRPTPGGGMVGVLRDATDRVTAEQALTESEDRYRLLTENAADVVLLLDGQDRVVWASPSLQRLTGWAPEDWVGDARLDVIHPDDLPAVREGEQALRSGASRSHTVQVRVRHRHGPYSWWSATAQRTGDDPDADVVVALRDVDEQVRQQEAVRRQSALREAALEAMLDPFALLEPVTDLTGAVVDFRYVEANPAAAAYLGLERGAVAGVPLTGVMAPDAAAGMVAACARVLDSGEPFVLDGQPLTSRISGGATRMFDMRVTPVEGLVEVVWRDVTDRVEAAAQVEASEARFRLVTDHAVDVILLASDGVMRWISPSLTTTLGWDPDDWVGHRFEEFTHPDDVPLAQQRRAEVTAGAERVTRLRLRDAAGAWHWVEVHAGPTAAVGGGPVGVVASFRVIDDVVAAEEALSASEEQYRLLAENSADVVVTGDLATGFLTYVSPAIRELAGWQPEDLVGTPMRDLLHPDDVPVAAASRPDVEAGSDTSRARGRLRRKDGSYVWAEALNRVVGAGEGSTASVLVAAIRDIQAEVEAQQALVAAQHRYRLLAENAGDFVMSSGPEGVIGWVSPSVTAVLGWRPEEMIGTDSSEFVHPDDLPVRSEAIASVQAGGSGRGRTRVRCADGSWRWLAGTLRALTDDQGSVLGRVSSWRDVQAEVEAEEALSVERGRLRALLDAGLDPHVLLTAVRDEAGEVVDFTYSDPNPACLAYLGVTAEELAATSMADLYPGEAAHGLRDRLADALDTATPLRVDGYVYPGLFGDGDRVFDIRGALVGDSVSLTWRDVTDAHAAAAALAASEDQYRMLAENASDVVFQSQPGGPVVWVSPSVRGVLGWAPEQVQGRSIVDWVHPDDLAAVRAAQAAASVAGAPEARTRMRLRTADGDWRWMSALGSIVYDDGQPLWGIDAVRDIQAEVDVEQALATSEEQYRLLATNATDVVYRLRVDGTLEWVSGAVERLLGFPVEEVVGRPAMGFVHPEDAERAAALAPEMLAGQRSRLRLRLVAADGSPLWVEFTGHPVYDEAGALVGLVGGWRDVDAEHRAGLALEVERARLAAVLDAELEPHVYLEAVRDGSGAIVDFVYRDVNNAACAYLGMSRDQVEGARVLDLLPGQAGSGMLAMYAAAVESGEPLALDDYAYPSEILDSERRYDIRAIQVGDGLSFAWRDVTERYEARGALAASEERLRLLTDNTTDTVVLADPDGAMRYVSPAVTGLLDWRPDDLLGHRVGGYLHTDDLPVLVDGLPRVDAGQPFTGTARFRCRDGTYRWVESSVTPVLADDGTLTARTAVWRDVTDRVAMLERLRESEERYRLLAQNATDVVYVIGPDGRITWTSDRVADILGWTVEEVVGRLSLDLIHPDDRAMAGERLADAARDGIDGYRTRMLTADGGHRWVDISAHPVTVDGEVVGVSGGWRDVHEEVLAQQAVAASEQRLRLMTDNVRDVVLMGEPDGTITYVSPAIEPVLGWQPGDLIGHTLTEFLHPDDLPVAGSVSDRADRGEAATGTARFRRRDGTYRWIESAVTPILADDGTLQARTAVWRDVTDRVEMLARLEASEERFRTAMHSAPAGMAVVSLGGRFLEVNPAPCSILGRDSGWLLDHRIADVLDDPDLDSDRTMRSRVLAGPERSATREHQMVRSDGDRIWVEHSIGLVRDSDGRPTSYVSQFLDVTEARQARERLRFLASHDALTHLLNRRELIHRIEDLLSRKPRTGTNLAVLFCDLDNLKTINDTHGHPTGDTVLAAVAERLRRAVRTDDLVARFGGDEFVVVLTTIHTLDDAAAVAAKIHDQVAAAVPTSTGDIPVTVSIGLALVEPGDDPAAALRRADTALLEAKRHGRNQTVVHPRPAP